MSRADILRRGLRPDVYANRPAPQPAALTLAWTDKQLRAEAALRAWWLARSTAPAAFALGGVAGSGKTSLLAKVRKVFDDALVFYTAMTGRAALRFYEATGIAATTLHTKFYAFPRLTDGGPRFEQLREPEGCELLVIDEASMLTGRNWRDLQKWITQGVRVLFVGDFWQLPPIGDSAEEDFSIFRQVEGVFLDTVMRSGSDILWAATAVRETQQLPRESRGAYTFAVPHDPIDFAVKAYLADPEDHALVTWRNETRLLTNARIRQALGRPLGLPQPGEPIRFCRNGPGVLNGEVARVVAITPLETIAEVPIYEVRLHDGRNVLVTCRGRTTWMDGGTPEGCRSHEWQISIHALAVEGRITMEPVPITWGYVYTAHSAQGSEFRRVTMFLSRGDMRSPYFNKPTTLPNGTQVRFGARWIYTGLTRAQELATAAIGR